jgi:hypothetical protein
VKTIVSWVRHLLWEAAPGAASDGLAAILHIGPAPTRERAGDADLVLFASDINEAKRILRQLAHLQTVSRVKVAETDDLELGDRRAIGRLARQLRGTGLIVTV